MLASLAVLAEPARRRAVLERLDQLFPVPAPHTLEQALADRAVLDAWLAQVVELAMARGALPWNVPARE